MSTFGDVLRNTFFGAGAFGDPADAFKMYAPPGLLDVFTPEQQAEYGRQIQAQMRNINADTRPTFAQIQKNLIDASKEKRGLDLTRELQTELQTAFKPPTPTPAPVSPAVPGQMPAAPGPVSPAVPGQMPAAPGPVSPAVPGQMPAPPATNNPSRVQAQRYLQAARAFAARGDGENAKRYVDIAMQLNPNPSESVRDLEYFGFNMQGQQDAAFDRLKQLNKSKASQTKNILSTGRKAEEAYAETLAKDLPGIASQAQLAQRTNESLAEIIANENRPTFSGLLAPGAIGATQFLQSFGVGVKPETLANSREFQANANILVLDFMGAMGGARGFSKEESAILYDAFPKIIDSPQARSRIARMLIARNNRLINDYNSTRKEFENMVGRKSPSPDIAPLDINAGPQRPGRIKYNRETGKFEP